jgi:TonB family protein
MRPSLNPSLLSAVVLAMTSLASTAHAEGEPAPATSAAPAPTTSTAPAEPPAPATSAAPAPVLVMPVRETAPEVPYPEGAKGDARVMLVLTIDKEGAVQNVVVQEGTDPFAAAAVLAAYGWRFNPATRDGVPITVKIRSEVGFQGPVEVPAPVEEPTAAPQNSAPKSAADGKPKALPPPPPRPSLEVLIRADKPPPSVTTVARTEVRQIPGTFGDPFRVLDTLPGVTPIISGLPYFYVRGAPPGNVGYFLDGIRVPYLFHVAIGPSIVNPAMVDRVDLYSGGYPAQFGRYAGAIVSAETTTPRDDLHGEGNLRLFDVGAMVEGGFADGKGTAMLGGRYSYTGGLLSLLSPTVGLDYRDYQARVTYDVTPRDRIGVFAFGAYDRLIDKQNGITTTLFGAEFYRFDTRYEHRLDSGGVIRVNGTLGFDQSRLSDFNVRDWLYDFRIALVQPLSKTITLRAGADAQFDQYSADPHKWTDPDNPSLQAFDALFPPRTDTALATYADVVWRLDPRVEITPGVRLDMYRSEGTAAVAADPRLSMRVDLTDRIRLLHALGIAHQTPSFGIPIPGNGVGGLQGGLQTGVQAASGVEVSLPQATTATLTAFDGVFLNMSDTFGVPGARDGGPLLPRSTGHGYGLEFYLRRRMTSRLGGYLSYTLSKSTRALGTIPFPSTFDRTHVASAALAYDLGAHWRAGTRFTFYTGAPVSSRNATLTDAERANPQRDPPFYRLDLRAERRWNLSGSRWFSFVAEFLNSTLHKETLSGREVGPVAIPSLGLEGGF